MQVNLKVSKKQRNLSLKKTSIKNIRRLALLIVILNIYMDVKKTKL